jgi:hypothetical protein
MWPWHLHFKKIILRQKEEELWKNSNISPCKNIPNLQKKSSKRNQNLSKYYYNSIITNFKFQHKPKISCFKNAHIKKKLDLLFIV